jgi:hypothetical protein
VQERPVDLRILLPAVADQDERQVGIGLEDLADSERLVLQLLPAGEAEVPVAEEERPCGQLLRGEEVGDDLVQIPWALGDIEDRVMLVPAAVAERALERSDPGERKAGARVLQQHEPGGAHQPGDLRLEHGVVHVADHAEARACRRNEHLRRSGGSSGS